MRYPLSVDSEMETIQLHGLNKGFGLKFPGFRQRQIPEE